MIQFASEQEAAQLMALWMEAFGDSEESAAYYFMHLHQDETMLVDLEAGEVCAMLTMLPLSLVTTEGKLPARYIFAVATKDAYRGQGRSTRLLARAHRYMKEQKVAASLLVPASESLFGFYEKRGYRKAFRLGRSVYRAAELPDLNTEYTLRPCTAGDYEAIRKAAFLNHVPFAAWEVDMLERVMGYARFCGAEFFHIQTARGEAVAYCMKEQDEVVVKELALSGMQAEEAVAILHTRYGAARYDVRTAPGAMDRGLSYEFAMLRDLSGKLPLLQNPYFNLAMD